MRLAFELVIKSLQRQLSYRTANVAGFITNLFFGLFRASIMIGLYGGAYRQMAGYTLADSLTYTALSQALMSFVYIYGWWDFMRAIQSGDVAVQLSRPVGWFEWFWWQDVGRAIGQLLYRGLPIVVLFAWFYGAVWPPTPAHWLAMLVSSCLGLLASFAWRFLFNSAAFWTVDAIGVGRLAVGFLNFFSGFLIPVAFFPPWLATLAHWTPFPSMVDTPIRIYLGLVDTAHLLPALLVQSLWAAWLVALCHGVVRLGVRKLVVQGG